MSSNFDKILNEQIDNGMQPGNQSIVLNNKTLPIPPILSNYYQGDDCSQNSMSLAMSSDK